MESIQESRHLWQIYNPFQSEYTLEITDFTRFSSYFERRHMEERMGKKFSKQKVSEKW